MLASAERGMTVALVRVAQLNVLPRSLPLDPHDTHKRLYNVYPVRSLISRVGLTVATVALGQDILLVPPFSLSLSLHQRSIRVYHPSAFLAKLSNL